MFFMEELGMKKLVALVITLLLGIGAVYAGGDQNVGTTGQGQTSTGSDAQGQSSQSRAGR
jgi:hypothetical protein